MAVSTIDALYNGTSEKLTTSATGITVTGTVAATAYTGDGSALTGTGSPSIDDNGNATAITIDSSENILAGKTSSAFNTAGFELFGNADKGKFWATRDGGVAAAFNRKSSDGDIALFAKDGATVGSIGSVSGLDLFVAGSRGAGQRYLLNNILPCNASGDVVDNTIDFGQSSYRYRDAYLSGGVYLGGTAAINKLDDVDSGTFAPTCAVGYNYRNCRYNKIGDVVTVSLDFQVASNSNGSNFILTNMPFTAVGDGNFAVGYNTTGEPDVHFFWQNTTIYGYDKSGNSRTFSSYSNDIIRISCTVRVT